MPIHTKLFLNTASTAYDNECSNATTADEESVSRLMETAVPNHSTVHISFLLNFPTY